jgi:hypothetical protein
MGVDVFLLWLAARQVCVLPRYLFWRLKLLVFVAVFMGRGCEWFLEAVQ